MKITIKTLQQKVFQVDAEGSETVGDLKQKVAASQGHPVEAQKLIYAGKVLPDSKTVESCEIKEKDFLVLMVQKPKPAPAAPAAPASIPVAAPAPEPIPVAPAPAQEPAPVAAPAAPAEPASFTDNASFLSGPALEAAISNMCDMGFPREEVMRAMRASFNNPNRAVEYLMTGIPDHLEGTAAGHPPPAAAAPAHAAAPVDPAAGAPAPVPAAAPGAAAGPNMHQNLFQLAQQQQQQQAAANPFAGGAGGPGGPMNLQQLFNSPQGQQIRDAITREPRLLQPVIEQLAVANPQLAAAIAANPQLLVQLLQNPPGGDGDEYDGGELPPGAHVVELTAEERDAVMRLEALGFPRQVVLEAYLACDKNEELAANYLFENGFDD